MREFVIEAKDAGKRLDRFLQKAAPGLTAGLAQKYFRQKDIKLNGHPAKKDAVLSVGDAVRAYIPEELFQPVRREDPLLSRFHWQLDVIYEDENLLLVDKRPGVMVHPDAEEKVNTLVTHVQAYLYQKGEYDSRAAGAFAPVPVNRIDRFTAGIVIFARTEAAMRVLNQKIRSRELDKRYLCIALGAPRPAEGTLKSYIRKNAKRVTVSDRPAPDAQPAETKYRTLAARDGLALLECALVTGRTHQIRAQFAHIKHPLLGDNQYGDAARNRRYGLEQQALCAYRLVFDFKTDAGPLNYLKGRAFSTARVPFLPRFFPDTDPQRL